MRQSKTLNVNTSKPTGLSNIVCPYCGVSVSPNSGTKEHVIGRRFVPKGALAACWNLLVWACEQCNNKKSDLEDDLSAITMAFNTVGLPGLDDEVLKKEANRKLGRSISRKTGKLVRKSSEKFSVRAELPNGLNLSGNFVGPPQLDERRVLELARL